MAGWLIDFTNYNILLNNVKCHILSISIKLSLSHES